MIPPLAVLVIIAVAPLLAHTLEAVTGIDPDVVDAARAQGMTEGQILRRVEIPLGLPVFMGGLRSALLQVIATATIAAYINGNNLGRYLFDGLAVRDYPRMLVATLLVAILAFVVDAIMALAQRAVTPVPLRGGGDPNLMGNRNTRAHWMRQTRTRKGRTHEPGTSPKHERSFFSFRKEREKPRNGGDRNGTLRYQAAGIGCCLLYTSPSPRD